MTVFLVPHHGDDVAARDRDQTRAHGVEVQQISVGGEPMFVTSGPVTNSESAFASVGHAYVGVVLYEPSDPPTRRRLEVATVEALHSR